MHFPFVSFPCSVVVLFPLGVLCFFRNSFCLRPCVPLPNYRAFVQALCFDSVGNAGAFACALTLCVSFPRILRLLWNQCHNDVEELQVLSGRRMLVLALVRGSSFCGSHAERRSISCINFFIWPCLPVRSFSSRLARISSPAVRSHIL